MKQRPMRYTASVSSAVRIVSIPKTLEEYDSPTQKIFMSIDSFFYNDNKNRTDFENIIEITENLFSIIKEKDRDIFFRDLSKSTLGWEAEKEIALKYDKGVFIDKNSKRVGTHTIQSEFAKASLEQTDLKLRLIRKYKEWIKENKEYLLSIKPTQNQTIKKEIIEEEITVKIESTKTEELKNKLNEYNFFEIEKVKSLDEKDKLIELLVKNQLPYQIAMLNYLQFDEYLLKEYAEHTKTKLHNILGKILDKGERDIRGNLNILGKSKDNKSRYTSYQHTETVKRDYSSLK